MLFTPQNLEHNWPFQETVTYDREKGRLYCISVYIDAGVNTEQLLERFRIPAPKPERAQLDALRWSVVISQQGRKYPNRL